MCVCTTFTCKVDLGYLKEADAILGTKIADSYTKNSKSEAGAAAATLVVGGAAAATPASSASAAILDVGGALPKKRGRPSFGTRPESKAQLKKKHKPAVAEEAE